MHEFGLSFRPELERIENEEAIWASIKELNQFGLKLENPTESIHYGSLLKEVTSILPHIRMKGLKGFFADDEFKHIY